jgi:hypothetical protein
MKNSNQPTAKKTPSFIAYHVPDREGADWTRIGAAWPHQDGKGFSLALDLIPASGGRITLRAYESKPDTAAQSQS